MNRAAKITIGVISVLLFLIAAGYGWRLYANNRKLDQLQVKAQEMFSQPRPTGNSGDRGRFEGFREMRQEVEALPESYQKEFRQSMGNMFQQREEKRYDDFFKLSSLERRKHLDQRIMEDEKRRKEWQARSKQRDAERAQSGTNAGPGGPGGPGGPPGGGRGGGPGGGGPRGGGPGRGGGGGMSARLDSTSPEFRAKRTEYRRAMEQRRKELGLPADQRRR